MVLSTSVLLFHVVFNASSFVLFPLGSAKPRLADVTAGWIWSLRREIWNRITRILPYGSPMLKDRRATRGGEIKKLLAFSHTFILFSEKMPVNNPICLIKQMSYRWPPTPIG